MACVSQRKCSTPGAMAEEFTLSFTVTVGNSSTIPDIAKNARRLGIADSSECGSYYASLRTKIQRVWCARLGISEQTAASAMERVPGIEDWPDFEATVETGDAEI